jgi:nitronate monooxygenase/enoyl-[acyl-carrier protein] reductase II
LGIEFPIIQAGMGVFTSAELAAAVSNAGGLGSVGTFLRPVEDLPRQLARLRALTSRPCAVNHLVPALDEDAFAHTLAARPPVIALALGDPGDLALVTTVPQAREAAARGVDVIIAQGGEAGGYGGTIATFTLLPQVVDAVHPLPVVAAGGIADGRGLAAALVLGAAGVNIGTRFLASVEAPIPLGWKHRIVEAEAQDAVKVEVWNDISPIPGSRGYGTVIRALRTPFIDTWQHRRDDARREADRLRGEVLAALQQGRIHELLPFAGESAGLVHDITPAGEIVQRLVAEARQALERSQTLLT